MLPTGRCNRDISTILVSQAELNSIIFILHVSRTGKQVCFYILPLHASQSSAPSLRCCRWLTIRCYRVRTPAAGGPGLRTAIERPPLAATTEDASIFATGSMPEPRPLSLPRPRERPRRRFPLIAIFKGVSESRSLSAGSIV